MPKKKTQGQLSMFPESGPVSTPHQMAEEIDRLCAVLLEETRVMLSTRNVEDSLRERQLRTSAAIVRDVDALLQKRMEQADEEDLRRARYLEELARRADGMKTGKKFAEFLQELQEQGREELKEVG